MNRDIRLAPCCAFVCAVLMLGAPGARPRQAAAASVSRPLAAAPTLLGVTPAAATAGAVTGLSITGSSIDSAAEVRLGRGTYGSASGLAVTFISASTLQATFPATITAAGAYTLFVSNPPYSSADRATLAFTVKPGALVRIDVSPAAPAIGVNQTRVFAAAGFDAHNNPIAGLSVNWTALAGGTLSGTPTTTSATYLAGTVAGAFPNAVRALTNTGSVDISGFASVTIQPGPLAQLAVSPSAATLTPGAQQQFTTQGYDSHGNSVSTAGASWSVLGGGTINSGGLFTAGGLGVYPNSVRVTLASLTATASVTVVTQAVDHIAITPGTLISVPLRGAQVVTATAYDSGNAPINGIVFNWSVNPGIMLEHAGSITAVIRAGVAPAFSEVSASAGGKSAAVPVTVRPATVQVAASPNPLTTDGSAAATIVVSAITAAGPVGPDLPVALVVGTTGGSCTLTPAQGVTGPGGAFISLLRCAHTSPTMPLSSTIALTASLPTQPVNGVASTLVQGRFIPHKTLLPLAIKLFPLVTGNHVACSALPLALNVAVMQRADDPFNIYSFVAPAAGVGVTLGDYAASGSLLLYRIDKVNCPSLMQLTFISQTPITGANFSTRYAGLTPGASYLLVLNTTGALSQQPYSLRLEP